MKFADINKDHFPTVVFTIKPFEPTVEQYKSFLNDMTELLNNHEGLIFIMDLSVAKYLPSDLRILQGEWHKKHEALSKKNLNAMVFVQNSAITAMMMKGIFLIKKPPVPYTVVKNIGEAYAWIGENFKLSIAR